MSAPILQRGDWIIFQFPAKTNGYGVMDDAANRETANELTRAFNAHGVMVQAWTTVTGASAGIEVVAVFRQVPPVLTVRDVIPND